MPPDSLIGVTGAQFAANEVVNIYWNYTGPGTGTLEGAPNASSSGGFAFYFTTPLAASGTYTIGAVGQTSGSIATGIFRLLPGLSVFPEGAGSGTPIQVTGNDFGAGETVKVYWNNTGSGKGIGTLIATAVGDATGSFTANAVIPTGNTPATVSIAGIGQATNTIARFKFTHYPPTLALAPLSGAANSELTMSAYGFEGGEAVQLFWNNSTTPIASGTTDLHGYLAPITITIPAGLAPGAYSVKAVGQTTQLTITNTFGVVAPSSNLSLTSGPVNSSVAVSGQGYTPGETVNILWNYTGPGTGTNVASATAGLAGTFEHSFTVPAATSGAYTMAAVGASSGKITQHTFTVSNGLAAFPANSSPGTSVTAAGSGFQANEQVKLYWDSTSGTLLTTATANANGNIAQAVPLPPGATPGNHSLISVGQVSQTSFTTSITINTNWGDFGLGAALHRENAHENMLNISSVGNLKLKWTASVANNNLGDSSPVYANGTIFLTTASGTLNAYNAISGALNWQYDPKTAFVNLGSALVDPAHNLVFFGSMAHQNPGSPSPFYALDAQSGALKWSVILPNNQYSFPTLAFQNVYIGTSLAHDSSGTVYALDEMSGNVSWHYTTVGGVWTAIGADTSTNTVFVSSGDPGFNVFAFNATTGAVRWNIQVPNSFEDLDPGSGLPVANGLVYTSSKNGNVYALHESDGTIAWSRQITKISVDDVSTPAIASNGSLYVGSRDGFLYALNATTGAVIWKAAHVGPVDSSPAIANGVVYFASLNNVFYALNANTGALLWSFTTGSKSYASPIVVNGWLYCGSDDGKLYAFSL
ncbi:MAG TPA: PQQ-binding-like beta-propeller repeat protein [Ktedonobacteraceae bacterium]|nr:PQQ-binding-like beta-propeller repeat protein [Ktedonobacteraceae bacterium]